MGLINYNEIDFKQSINKENKVINFNGSEIQIVKYLSIKDKYDLVMITLQKSLEKGIYNDLKVDMYFDLHLIYMYTNIVFSNEDRTDEAGLYDTLKNSGLIDVVKAEINQNEIAYLRDIIDRLQKTIMKYRNTFGTVFGAFIEQLPENMEKAKELIEGFDPEKYKALAHLAAQIKAGTVTN